jgi:hypothetical protein
MQQVKVAPSTFYASDPCPQCECDPCACDKLVTYSSRGTDTAFILGCALVACLEVLGCWALCHQLQVWGLM